MKSRIPSAVVLGTGALALLFALPRAGNSIAAKIPMMAITTSNSIRVKARCALRCCGNMELNIIFVAVAVKLCL